MKPKRNPTFLGYNPKTDQLAEWIEVPWFGSVLLLEEVPDDERALIANYNCLFDDDKQFPDWIKIGEL